ncbi:MAG: hypothetical protein ACPL7B_01265 [Candidatus Poribacteria bacterium]
MLIIVSDYDAQSGKPESSFCLDNQGLSCTKRRKHSFLSQQMLMLLNQLAHNMILWIQHWLIKSLLTADEDLSSQPSEQQTEDLVNEKSLIVKTVKERGMKRFVHQLLSISGLVTLKGQRVCKVVFNPFYTR